MKNGNFICKIFAVHDRLQLWHIAFTTSGLKLYYYITFKKKKNRALFFLANYIYMSVGVTSPGVELTI